MNSNAKMIGAIVVSMLIVAGFTTLLIFWAIHPPATANDLLTSMTGVLGGAVVTVVNYWMGTSASSSSKDDTIAKLANSGTNGASAGGVGGKV